MVMAATTTKYVFDLQPGDVYWCTADCGWITGHTYLTYGPLLCGAQCVVFEGVPSYPTPGRSWQVVEKYNVSCPFGPCISGLPHLAHQMLVTSPDPTLYPASEPTPPFTHPDYICRTAFETVASDADFKMLYNLL